MINNEDTIIIDERTDNEMMPENFEPGNENENNEQKGDACKKVAVGAAAVAGAAVVGGAAAYAAGVFDSDGNEEIADNIEVKVEDKKEEVEEKEEEHEEQHEEHHHHHKSDDDHHSKNVTPKPEPEPDFFEDNDVEISSIDIQTDEEGELYLVAEGTVNDHMAEFVSTDGVNVTAYAVDENDDLMFQDNEIHEVKAGKMDMEELADHYVEPEDNILDNDIHITEIETTDTEDGDFAILAHGTVNDHKAMFVSDSEGSVLGYGVDENDNNNFEDHEIHELQEGEVSFNDLVEVAVIDDPVDEPEVQVVALENDVDINGNIVNVAQVNVDEQEVLLIDANQDNEVNFVMSDTNHNNEIEDDEIEDVTDEHISMPTYDDIEETYASNDVMEDNSYDDIALVDM